MVAKGIQAKILMADKTRLSVCLANTAYQLITRNTVQCCMQA